MAQTAEQLEARLDKLRERIDSVILAQSYSVGGRQHVNPLLKTLMEREASLVRQLHRLTKGAFVLSDFSGDAEDEA
jgi:hypothetical protein